MKPKVFIPWRNNLNGKILEKHLDIVGKADEADFIISQSTLNSNFQSGDFKKTIHLAIEPPLSSHRIQCYNWFPNFHTVITHNPTLPNHFSFTKNDEAQFYPTRADPYPFVTRTNTKFRKKGVFYAGMRGFYEDVPDSCGGINITGLRTVLGEYFLENFPGSKIIGKGWGVQKTKVDNWRLDKYKQIEDSGCDFILALENTIYPNYLYEKIWDGFHIDRVTLYLGDPNVEKHIPLDCFVDLRPYFNKETHEFDTESLGKRLMGMTQEEYDTILNNAREFRKTSLGRYEELQDELTEFIVRRIRDGEEEFS